MANLRYQWSKVGSLDGSINYARGVFRAGLFRNAAYNPTHRVLQDVLTAGGVLVVTSDPIGLVITSTGAVDAPAAVYFPSVARGGAPMPTMIVWQASGPAGGAELAPTEQRLCLFINRGRNFPAPAGGKPIRCRWPRTAVGIFQSG